MLKVLKQMKLKGLGDFMLTDIQDSFPFLLWRARDEKLWSDNVYHM